MTLIRICSRYLTAATIFRGKVSSQEVRVTLFVAVAPILISRIVGGSKYRFVF